MILLVDAVDNGHVDADAVVALVVAYVGGGGASYDVPAHHQDDDDASVAISAGFDAADAADAAHIDAYAGGGGVAHVTDVAHVAGADHDDDEDGSVVVAVASLAYVVSGGAAHVVVAVHHDDDDASVLFQSALRVLPKRLAHPPLLSKHGSKGIIRLRSPNSFRPAVISPIVNSKHPLHHNGVVRRCQSCLEGIGVAS